MARMREATTSMVMGELTALLAGRGDTKVYKNGAAKLTNRSPLTGGGNRTRPGLLHNANLTVASGLPKIVDFVFSSTQAYVMVFSDGRLDVFTHPVAAGASPVATLTSSVPWTAAMIPTLTFSQNYDTMLVFHPDMRTQVIKRTGASTFTRSDYAFEENSGATKMFQPYYKFAEPTVTLTASGTTGAGVTFTASASVFNSSHVGGIIRKDKKEVLVTAYTSPTVVTGTCRETITTTATADWDEAVFSPGRGWARCGTFHRDRGVLAGAKSRPSGIYLSKIGAYFNFDLGTGEATEAIWDAATDEKVAEIRAVVSADQLLVWSDAAMFAVISTPANPLTPENFDIKKQEPYGVIEGVRPVEFDQATLFVHASGSSVREATYADTSQKFNTSIVSKLAPHLIATPTAMAVLYGSPDRPEQLALLVNGDGHLSVFHSVRGDEIAAWYDWDTTGTFRSVCTVIDTVYVVVERSIYNGTKYCLEKFDEDRAALDCQRRATSGAATRTFATAAPHLQGLTAAVSSKGHSLGTYTVGSGGSITLSSLSPEVTEVEVGLPYTQLVRPMPAHVDLPDGPARGMVMGVVRSLIVIDRAAAFKVGGTDILLTFQGDDYATEAPTKTGTVEVRHLGYDREGQKDIVISEPVKVSILSITRDLQISTG